MLVDERAAAPARPAPPVLAVVPGGELVPVLRHQNFSDEQTATLRSLHKLGDACKKMADEQSRSAPWLSELLLGLNFNEFVGDF